MSYEDILARVRAAEAAHGREPGSVTLIAVSKVQPLERVVAVLEAGQRTFGENYVQEAAAKWPDLRAQFGRIKGQSRLTWEDARPAARAAWDRVERVMPGDSDSDRR